MEIIIKNMEQAHIDDVCNIEYSSFTKPWSKKSFEDELKNPNAVYSVAIANGKGVGYIGGWIIQDQYDINNIAVLPQFRKQGIAKALLKQTIDFCAKKKLTQITLEVRQSNEPAKALYNKFGFIPVGIRKKYYSDTGEDAIIMALEL